MLRKKSLYLLAILIVMLAITTGCRKKSMEYSNKGEGTTQMDSAGSDANESYMGTEIAEPAEDDTVLEESLTNTSALTSNESKMNSLDKIIRRANLEVETQDFDKLIKSVDSKIKQLGGYVENSEISGTNYYSNNMRYGNIIARVPKNKVDEFIGTVYNIANVVNKQESTENITLQYIDIESHKKALEIEQERLLALLKKVETLEDIITLETRLSSVRYELQSYETQLRTYDNLVEYSTVTLSIQEVERISTVVEDKQSVWSRIKSGLSDSMYHLTEGLTNFFVAFVVNLPFLFIWAVIVSIIVLVCRKYYKKSLVKNNLMNQSSNQDTKQKDDNGNNNSNN